MEIFCISSAHLYRFFGLRKDGGAETFGM